MNKKRILGTLILLAALFVAVGSVTASKVFGQVFNKLFVISCH